MGIVSSPLSFEQNQTLWSSSDVALYALYNGGLGLSLGLLGAICFLFCNRPTRNLSAWIFFLISVMGLVILLALCAVTLVVRISDFQFVLCSLHNVKLGDPNPNSEQCTAILEAGPELTICRLVFLPVLVMISDGAICYRAGALTQRRLVRVVLGLFYMICLLGTGAFIIFVYVRNFVTMGAEKWASIEFNVSFGFLGGSTLCNLAATCIFGATLWSHRRFLRVDLQLKGAKITSSQRILGSIVESGVAFCTFQVTYLILTTTLANPWVLSALEVLYIGFSGMYPAFILFVINLQTLSHDMSFEATIGTIRSNIH